jgi:predicted O-linked N-acetylglucosamine transferase (SPINDLY family)
VTREGRFMRGRLASAILKRIGLAELVVPTEEAYVELAVRLAQDPDYSEAVASRMERERHALYEDQSSVRALEVLLAQAR